jgi:hypothetical protein
MAAPAFRAATNYPGAKATSRTVTVPAGSKAGDALFVAIKVAIKGTILPPAGWTKVVKQKTAAIEEWTCAVFQLPNWDGVTTEYTFTWGGESKESVALIWSVEGADTTTPVNAVSGEQIQENTPASTKATVPAYTTTSKECRLFAVVFNNEGFTYTPGAGYTELADQADGPEAAYKSASVEPGEQAKYEATSGSAVTLTTGFAVQPPLPANITVSAPPAIATAGASTLVPTFELAPPAAAAVAGASSPAPGVALSPPPASATAGASAPTIPTPEPPTPLEALLRAELTVAIITANGTVYRWGPDEWNAENIPQALAFSTAMPGGFKTATITLPRRIDLEYPDLNLLDTVQILGPGNEIVWEGRDQQLPRTHGDTFSITVGAVGWSTHLMDDPSFREIYIDSDLSGWGEPSTTRKSAVINFGNARLDANMGAGWQGSGEDPPGITFDFNGIITIAGRSDRGEAFYNAGPDLGALLYHFHRLSGGTGASWTTQGALVKRDYDDLEFEPGPDHDAVTNANPFERIDAPGPGYKFARLISDWDDPGSGTAMTDLHSWEQLKVLGNHGLTLRGESDWPNVGFYASDIVADVVHRAAPLLNFTTGENGSIQPTLFPIPHLVFGTATSAQEVIMKANGYHLFDWGVWERREFFFNEPDPDRLTWQARLSEGARLDLEGTQVADVYNGVFLSYTDPGGKAKTVGPPGSGADVEDESLADTSSTNPVNAHGIPKKWALLGISQITTSAAAIQLGRIYLGEKSLPQRQGTLILTGTATHPTAGKCPVWSMRAGHWVQIVDHPIDIPRKIIETNYDAATQTNTCTLDNTSQKAEAILERLGVSLIGVI